jgi:lipopolysaccharide transport system permease protein
MSNWFNLLKYFLVKDIRGRYAGSGFGVLWTAILPVFQIVLYWFVFSSVMHVRPYAGGKVSYVFFLLSTYFFWLAMSDGIFRSGTTILDNAELVKKVPFPIIVLPIAVTLSGYIQNMIGVAFFIIAFSISGWLHPALLLIVPVLILQILFSLGVAMLLAAIVTYVRDLQQVIGYVLQGMFFLSPILYSMESIPEKIRPFTYLNPVTVFMESYHKIIFERSFPGIWYFGGMALIAGLSFFLGL